MSVTAAKGFLAAGTAAGVKPAGQLDYALVAAERSVPAAGVFTKSLTSAPPVELSRGHLRDGHLQAVLINSGCANAGTGGEGLAAARTVAAEVAHRLGSKTEDLGVCSTGPIGPPLPVSSLVGAAPDLVADLRAGPDAGRRAAEAIMTTDTVSKETTIAGEGFVLGGMAKGAGMVRPDMATMLAVLTTDAVVDSASLAAALNGAVEESFNSLNLDGCQSTNDSVIVMASGASGVEPSKDELTAVLTESCRRLAYQIARDAEGATRVIRLRIRGAPDNASARRAGMSIADSALVRASFYGSDPNWGRILGQLGVAGVEFDPGTVAIAYEGVEVAREGVMVAFDEPALVARLGGNEFAVDVKVGDGPGFAEVLTTDLTPEYVLFNAERS